MFLFGDFQAYFRRGSARERLHYLADALEDYEVASLDQTSTSKIESQDISLENIGY